MCFLAQHGVAARRTDAVEAIAIADGGTLRGGGGRGSRMEVPHHGGVARSRPTRALRLGDGGEEGHEAGVTEELSVETCASTSSIHYSGAGRICVSERHGQERAARADGSI